MRRLAVILSTVALLGVGAAIAVAGGGGSTHDGNAGYWQYHPKPGCGPWKSDGWAGGSGHHDGQPPKRPHRRDCPKPPCHDHSHFSSFTTGSSHDGDCNDDCDQHWSSFTTGSSHDGDCNDPCEQHWSSFTTGSSHDGDCNDDCDHQHQYSGSSYGGGSSGEDDCRSSLPGTRFAPTTQA